MTPAASSARIETAGRLRGTLLLPPDKSIAHRALIVGALGGGPTTVRMQRPGRDVESTIACLRALGVIIDDATRGSYVVSGEPWLDATLDCGNSGTTMRLLAGALAGRPLRVVLDGDASLRARPMERVAHVLRAAGAEAQTDAGHPPLRLHGRSSLSATTHELPVASAQLAGAACLAALAARGVTQVTTPAPVRDHTARLLAFAGVRVEHHGLRTTILGPARPAPFDLQIPGDLSAGAAWLVAAAIHPDAELTLDGVGLNPTRMAVVQVLRQMGADITVDESPTDGPEPSGRIIVRGGAPLQATSIGGSQVADLIDELPLLGVAMAAAAGRSELRDAGELRVKESDRIAAMVAGLTAIGAEVEELADGWRVGRGAPHDARVTTRGDHRIAMAFAVAAASGVARSVELDDPDCIGISYPGFLADLAAVRA